MILRFAHMTYKVARRIVITVVGLTVLLLGAVMIITPGPALVFIPLGLAILSIEFARARYWLRKIRDGISNRNSTKRAERAEAHRERANSERE